MNETRKQPSFRKYARKALRHLVYGLPRSKLLNFASETYISKYHNLQNPDMHTNGEYRLLRAFLLGQARPMIFDVGANVGRWTETALAINSDAAIHMFEPFPPTYEVLVTRRLGDNIHANCVALSNEPGTADFHVFENASEHNSFFPRVDRPSDKTVQIEVTTLAAYCAENHITSIDYLKIDAEGNDFAVLQGADSLLHEGRINAIQFEYGDNYISARVFLKDVFDLIAPYDYTIYKIHPRHLEHIPRYHHMRENFTYTNYAIIRNGVPIP